mmetsp:Transcript_73529/g.102098  ORF Transcript_73529/g.102098 Transcript_73529/m.102098 type:complete len:207 (-) Transcript_73529:688-1308(-)
MLLSNLMSKLSDAIHEIFTLAVKHLKQILMLFFFHLVFAPDIINFTVDVFKLVLLTGEFLLQVKLCLFLGFDFLLNSSLDTLSVLNLSLLLQKLLFLLDSLLEGFITVKHFFFHILDLSQQLLLLTLFFLGDLFPGLELSKQLHLFLFSDLFLSFNLRSFFFELFANILLLLFKVVFKLFHFVWINIMFNLSDSLSTTTALNSRTT